jgi:hypothetical protein
MANTNGILFLFDSRKQSQSQTIIDTDLSNMLKLDLTDRENLEECYDSPAFVNTPNLPRVA